LHLTRGSQINLFELQIKNQHNVIPILFNHKDSKTMRHHEAILLQAVLLAATLISKSTAFQAPLSISCRTATTRPFSASIRVYRAPTKWDKILDEGEEEDEEEMVAAPPDMKYVPRNVVRQNKNFQSIRDVGGPEMTNDVYVPEPDSDEGVMWFVGKVARTSDVSVEQAVARQWPLIVQHAANLRPIELYPHRTTLEIWVAPGDSELEVAYNRPDLTFQKMSPDVEGAEEVKSSMIGFQGEIYEQGQGMGFRTWRKKDGKAAKPETQTPDVPAPDFNDADAELFSEEKFKVPTEEEMRQVQAYLNDLEGEVGTEQEEVVEKVDATLNDKQDELEKLQADTKDDKEELRREEAVLKDKDTNVATSYAEQQERERQSDE